MSILSQATEPTLEERRRWMKVGKRMAAAIRSRHPEAMTEHNRIVSPRCKVSEFQNDF